MEILIIMIILIIIINKAKYNSKYCRKLTKRKPQPKPELPKPKINIKLNPFIVQKDNTK